MAKLNDPQRAQRYVDRWVTIPDLTQQDAVRAGFRAGLRAAKADSVPEAKACRDELQRRFLFLVRHGLWDEYMASGFVTPNAELKGGASAPGFDRPAPIR